MRSKEIKIKRYNQRKNRVRAKIAGTEKRPRLSVFRSNAHIYAQIINDDKGVTLVASSDVKTKKAKGPEQSRRKKVEIAEGIGEEIAKKALVKKIKTVVFDRNGFMYHGRIKAVAEGARKGGLIF
jgi:large subunit ribosomal protein L18